MTLDEIVASGRAKAAACGKPWVEFFAEGSLGGAFAVGRGLRATGLTSIFIGVADLGDGHGREFFVCAFVPPSAEVN